MAPHLIDRCALHGMIAGVRSRLVEDIRRCSAELHPLSLEAQISDPGDVFLPVTKIVRKEESQPLYFAEARSFDGQLLDVRRLRQLKLLGALLLFGGPEVDIIPVDEHLEGLGCAGRVGCPQQD